MPRSEAQQRLVTNWFNIVLTIISVTQGVATGFLFGQFPHTLNYAVTNWSNLIVLVLFLLSLVISLRVFQTIITGVLDDEFTMPNFSEFFLVFVIVSVEYCLFSLFERIRPPQVAHPEFLKNFLISFYKWGIALAVIGALGYTRKLWRLKRRHKTRNDYYYTELWLQRRNIFGMLALVAIQFFLIGASKGVFNFSLNGNGHISFLGVMIAVLFANINYSLWSTFGEDVQKSKQEREDGKPASKKLEIEIIHAKNGHVAALRDLLVQHFGYVYEALFCNGSENKIIVPKMLELILKSFGGRHALGYKSFWIAHPRDDTEGIVGMLLLKISAERRRRFLTTLSIIKVVFLNFGFSGLLRVWRNWRAIRGISQEVGTKELHIVYLAVSDKARKRQVGMQLLEHARVIAREEKKSLITLCVRENNPEAIEFFCSQGFKAIPTEDKTEDKADELLRQGAIKRMVDTRTVDKSDLAEAHSGH